jgi:hypothetical protein
MCPAVDAISVDRGLGLGKRVFNRIVPRRDNRALGMAVGHIDLNKVGRGVTGRSCDRVLCSLRRS